MADELAWRTHGREIAENIFNHLDEDGRGNLSIVELARWLRGGPPKPVKDMGVALTLLKGKIRFSTLASQVGAVTTPALWAHRVGPA